MNREQRQANRDEIFVAEATALMEVHKDRLAAFTAGIGSEIKLACDTGVPFALVVNELVRMGLEALCLLTPAHVSTEEFVDPQVERFRTALTQIREARRSERKAS